MLAKSSPREGTGMARQELTARITIVDDVPVNVKLLQAYLSQAGFSNVATLGDSTKALAAIHRDRPDLLLLDLMMPGVSGLEILEAVRQDKQLARLPVLIVTGADDGDVKREALDLGANDLLRKPVDVDELIPRVRNLLLIKRHQDELEEKVRQRTRELDLAHRELVVCLARAAEFRDSETGHHVFRVGHYAAVIADELGFSESAVSMIQQAAALHDLGKIAVSDTILLKPGKLSPEEFALMQRHCNRGKEICQPMSHDELGVFCAHTTLGAEIVENCASSLLKMAAVIALTHHEKWDGSGYPLALAGEDIPLEGRITAVADVFDALSTRRPYKPAFPLDRCFEVMEEDRGSHFDPQVLDAFVARKKDVVAIQIAYADVD